MRFAVLLMHTLLPFVVSIEPYQLYRNQFIFIVFNFPSQQNADYFTHGVQYNANTDERSLVLLLLLSVWQPKKS